jgi:hypothetical protein
LQGRGLVKKYHYAKPLISLGGNFNSLFDNRHGQIPKNFPSAALQIIETKAVCVFFHLYRGTIFTVCTAGDPSLPSRPGIDNPSRPGFPAGL